MWQFGVIFLAFLVVAEVHSGDIPSYVHPCSKSKDFRSCCIKQGNEVLPFLLKGDKEFKIPNCLPLKLEKVDLDAGPNLKVKFTDIDLYGLDTITLLDMDVDFDKHFIMLELDAKNIEIQGQYEVDGKILVLAIKGKGPFNITGENCHFKYTFPYKLEKKGGNEYAIIQDDDKLEYKLGKMYIKLDNLFNGNKAMGDNVNNFLNENQDEVIKELGGAIEATVTTIAKTMGGGILATVPYNKLFLE